MGFEDLRFKVLGSGAGRGGGERGEFHFKRVRVFFYEKLNEKLEINNSDQVTCFVHLLVPWRVFRFITFMVLRPYIIGTIADVDNIKGRGR
jgi:hypothetical protein